MKGGFFEIIKEVGEKIGNKESSLGVPDFAKKEVNDSQKSTLGIPDFAKKESLEETNSFKEIDKSQIEINREKGAEREKAAYEELCNEYPEEEGYNVLSERYLRDEEGNIAKDPETGEARRIDHIVTKDDEVVKSVEVTSETASKDVQMAKEQRIRDSGGNYIRDPENGELIKFSNEKSTEIDRRV